MSDCIKGKGLTYSEALSYLQGDDAGKRKVRRLGWNGKGMWIARRAGVKFMLNDKEETLLPFLFMFTAQSDFTHWLCSQTDSEAKDWEIVTEENTNE